MVPSKFMPKLRFISVDVSGLSGLQSLLIQGGHDSQHNDTQHNYISVTTSYVTTFSITKLSITTLSIMAISITIN